MGKVRRKRHAKRLREGRGEVPTSSFSDIAFLLIIYFMVVTTLVQTRGLTADMPTGQKSESADMEKVPMVSVADGRIIFNDNGISLDGLRNQLKEMELREQPQEDRVVMLEATGTTDYEMFYQAVAVIESTGGVIAMVQEADDSQ